MYTQVEKQKESKNTAFVNVVAQKKSIMKQGFGFVDNRPLNILSGSESTIQKQYPKFSQPSERQLAPSHPIQRLVYFGPSSKPIKSTDELGDLHSLFNIARNNWKKLRGISPTNTAAQEDWIDKRVKILERLIKDTEIVIRVSTKDQLKNIVYQYYEHYMREEVEMVIAKQTQPHSVDLAEGYGNVEAVATGKKGDVLYSQLQKYKGRIFPEEKLDKVYQSSLNPGGHGFEYELELTLSALEQVPGCLVQLGSLSEKAIEEYLKGPIQEHEKEKAGPVGADVVIWFPPDHTYKKWGADFVQAKSIKFSSLKDELTKAKNQLEGNNAEGHAKEDSRVSDREISLRGKGHFGSIFIQIYDEIEERIMSNLARACLSSSYVTRIVIESLQEQGRKYIYEK